MSLVIQMTLHREQVAPLNDFKKVDSPPLRWNNLLSLVAHNNRCVHIFHSLSVCRAHSPPFNVHVCCARQGKKRKFLTASFAATQIASTYTAYNFIYINSLAARHVWAELFSISLNHYSIKSRSAAMCVLLLCYIIADIYTEIIQFSRRRSENWGVHCTTR